jgi:hypothetical protein
VIVLFELRLFELVEVIHTLPQFTLAGWVGLILFTRAERDMRDATFDENETAIIE